MQITIEAIPHKDQRYDTVGDWYNWHVLGSPMRCINVSSELISPEGDTRMALLVAIHELVESALCEHAFGSKAQEIVDKWDMSHPELDEPGEHPECPYRIQHIKAETIEEIVADDLEVDWETYMQCIANVTSQAKAIPTQDSCSLEKPQENMKKNS